MHKMKGNWQSMYNSYCIWWIIGTGMIVPIFNDIEIVKESIIHKLFGPLGSWFWNIWSMPAETLSQKGLYVSGIS
jgi:hypothetical protein